MLTLAACAPARAQVHGLARATPPVARSTAGGSETLSAPPTPVRALPGTRLDVYAHTAATDLSPAVRADPRYVYVPNGTSDTVTVIDQRTGHTVRTFPVGNQPEHVVPSYDLKTLWVTSDAGNSLTGINPRTGRPGRRISVPDPYNLYFTPDGKSAIVVAERLQRLDFRDPHTFRLQKTLPVRCPGIDHADFSGDGRYLLATCEFSARLVKVDLTHRRIVGYLDLAGRSSPQDIRVAPDGRTFFVADQDLNAVVIIDGRRLRRVGTVHGLRGAHGLYPSRDARRFYVSDRRGSAVSVVDIARRAVVQRWRIPGGGSPDMGGVSIDGTRLWLTGRYTHYLYEFDTVAGRLVRRLPVGSGPHGAAVWPQPGRYSLGHTSTMR